MQALDRPFDYAIPERLQGKVEVGSVVRVVLHGRGMRAFVTDLLEAPAVAKANPLRSLVSPQPLFGADEVELARWIARRYVVPLGLVFHDAVPGRFSSRDTEDLGEGGEGHSRTEAIRPKWLTTQIQSVGETCIFPPSLRDEPELIAYLASQTAKTGRQTLVVCPRVEIATSIAAEIARAVLLHGAERPADRAAGWAAVQSGRADVAVVGRAGLLVPVPRLGLVVVASAHDRSLKSERAPRLHALVVAQQRARRANVPFVASSPAPPIELAAASATRWIGGGRSTVRPETARPRGGPLTPRLIEVVRWAIAKGSDALVFTGRRGDTLRLRCADCGWSPACVTCRRGLVPDNVGATSRLRCRVCGSDAPVPETCGSCSGVLSGRGWGHERVARELERAGIEAPVVRVVRGEVPEDRPHPAVVIGTLAAAHATRDAGCVCVADLDQLLGRPEFRASEYALQVLHELAGVLAPGGRFLVQTREPEHHAVQAFMRNSYRYFFDREIPFRKETGYPPFGGVVRVEIDPASIDDLRMTVRSGGAELIGALPRGRKLNALVRGPDVEKLLDPMKTFAGAHSGARVDVDPIDIL